MSELSETDMKLLNSTCGVAGMEFMEMPEGLSEVAAALLVVANALYEIDGHIFDAVEVLRAKAAESP